VSCAEGDRLPARRCEDEDPAGGLLGRTNPEGALEPCTARPHPGPEPEGGIDQAAQVPRQARSRQEIETSPALR
jgi:hypothetical protein